jgi:hypothetical protein
MGDWRVRDWGMTMGGPPNHTEDEGEGGEDGETEQMRLQYTPYKEME